VPFGFKFMLVLPDGTPAEPALFVTAIPNWRVGEKFLLGDGSQFRILHIHTDMTDDRLEELYSRGINAIWTVEPIEP
jgi:hypothetical protein